MTNALRDAMSDALQNALGGREWAFPSQQTPGQKNGGWKPDYWNCVVGKVWAGVGLRFVKIGVSPKDSQHTFLSWMMVKFWVGYGVS